MCTRVTLYTPSSHPVLAFLGEGACQGIAPTFAAVSQMQGLASSGARKPTYRKNNQETLKCHNPIYTRLQLSVGQVDRHITCTTPPHQEEVQ